MNANTQFLHNLPDLEMRLSAVDPREVGVEATLGGGSGALLRQLRNIARVYLKGIALPLRRTCHT